jgi:hypothetical protein
VWKKRRAESERKPRLESICGGVVPPIDGRTFLKSECYFSSWFPGSAFSILMSGRDSGRKNQKPLFIPEKIWN